MVRKENIETASTVTSIIPASTVNSDHNSTIIITQNNQPEPISSELINLDIINTLQKAKNLANNQEPAITPQAAPKKVIDIIMEEANQLQKDKELTPPQEGSVDIYKASQKAYNNELKHKEYQILSDLWKKCKNSYLTVIKFLGHPSTCKLLNGWHPLMEKKNMMLLAAEWSENNPSPPKKVPKTAPVASSSNFNVKKQPQAQKKGKGKAPATKPYIQGYRILNIQQETMENVFQMARTMMELQKKEEARLKYQK
ncbi:hypothetical protein O181_112013 [Austropuccinia psidii MF-1]|uniref:No apical meristem-associated C-terminal domain-containing protein n=1 Tax=Austropuccinia psidii MF-1 TaxID=1389203 RepID=A0A9Q3PS94_9BASI|nr:hypothetical protein [Austropuccinia psidii MF-1]